MILRGELPASHTTRDGLEQPGSILTLYRVSAEERTIVQSYNWLFVFVQRYNVLPGKFSTD